MTRRLEVQSALVVAATLVLGAPLTADTAHPVVAADASASSFAPTVGGGR